MRIAVLETDTQVLSQVPRFGGLATMVGDWLCPAVPSLSVAAVPVTDAVAPLPDPSGFDGYVITGSRASAYDPEPWIARLEAYLRALHRDRRPILGLCFGHQVLARALGGQVARVGWRVGETRIDAPLLAGMARARAHVWHQDQVVTVPAGARVLAAYPGCAAGALGYGQSALSLQWHPEYPPDYMAQILASEGPGSLPAPVFRAAMRSLSGDHDGAAVARAAAQALGWH